MKKLTLPYAGPTPRRAHSDDAGMDLATPVQVIARAGGITTINTGFRTAIPQGHVGLVIPRSSLYRRGLHLANTIGVIDAGYRGEWVLQIANRSRHNVLLEAGERLAQAVIVPCVIPELHELSEADFNAAYGGTARGAGGFGSTGA